jgi:hypothetical protein
MHEHAQEARFVILKCRWLHLASLTGDAYNSTPRFA